MFITVKTSISRSSPAKLVTPNGEKVTVEGGCGNSVAVIVLLLTVCDRDPSPLIGYRDITKLLNLIQNFLNLKTKVSQAGKETLNSHNFKRQSLKILKIDKIPKL